MTRYHLLDASWNGPILQLVGADEDGGLHRLPWAGPLDWTVGPDRRCVGRIEDGQHVPCPHDALVAQWAACPRCDPMESPDCIFEPRGQSDPDHHCTLCDRPHIVYAAFHGTLPKIGMTSTRRVATRLREQGADAWFTITELPDRATARAEERRIAFLYDVPEYRTHRETLPQLTRPVDWDRIVARANDLRHRLADRYDPEEALHRITDHPVPVPLPGRPHRVQSVDTHRGTCLGAKGAHLFYAAQTTSGRLDVGQQRVAALHRHDLVGRTITVGA